MSDWKPENEGECQDFLYIEEINSNDGTSQRLTGINTSQSVKDLKKAIATELKNPEGWQSVSIAFADKELSDREFVLDVNRVNVNVLCSQCKPLFVRGARSKRHVTS
jgi:hypothetical protein